MATKKEYSSDFGEWYVKTDEFGTTITQGCFYTEKRDIMVDDEYTVGNNDEVIAYASKNLGVDIEAVHGICVVSELTANDPLDVIEAIHFALYKCNNRDIEKWIYENYDKDDWDYR